MFCHNCNTEFEESEFCPNCGRNFWFDGDSQSFSQTEALLQKSGQAYCPRCLSTSITVREQRFFENGFLFFTSKIASLIYLLNLKKRKAQAIKNGPECVCMKCGFSWFTNIRRLYDQYNIYLKRHFGNHYSPLTIGGAADACLQIYTDCVRICRSGEVSAEIYYDELAAVAFQKTVGPFYGWMTFRDKANRKRRFPRTFSEAGEDRLTIYYELGHDKTFYQVFLAMKEIVRENKRSGLF